MKRGKFWKFCLAFSLLFLASSLLYSESETELTVPSLEPDATYEMKGQDIMDLYQTVIDLNETKEAWKNLTLETQTNSENALELAQEYAKENKKLTLSNNFLIGTTVCSVGICVAGVITFICLNTK